MTRSKRQNIISLGWLLPILAYFLLFSLPPIYMLFYYSFTDLRYIAGTESWCGFQNYIDIFTIPKFLEAFGTTFLMAIFLMVFGLITGFGVALMLRTLGKGKVFFRTLWYIPVLLAMPVIAKLLSYMLWTDGFLNQAIKSFGGEPVDFYASTFWMYFWIVFLVVWKNIGSSAILFLAAFGGISPEIYEAAKIDGASRTRMLFSITLPLIRPVMGFVIINGAIGALGTFEPVQLISHGDPNRTTVTILYEIYNQAFMNREQGFASALSVVVFIVTLLVTILNMRFTDSSLLTGKERDA